MIDSPDDDVPVNIEAIIDRMRNGDALPDEQRVLMAWRRESLSNEQAYRRTLRLFSLSESLVPAGDERAPTAAALLASRRHPPGGAWWRPLVRGIPWVIAAGAVLAVFLNRGQPTAVRDSGWGLADVVTGTSEMSTVQLRDGSVVRLAPSSRLRFVASDSLRSVELDGRAFFAVAKNPRVPFVVRTRAGEATVLGTRFELVAQEQDLKLIVVEGRVALSATGGRHRVEVAAGEVSGVRDSVTLTPKRVDNGERMDRWVGKFLVFQATPVRDAAKQIERMYGIRIRPDSTIANRTVTATFTDQTAEQVLDIVCSVTHAQCVSQAGDVSMSRKN